MRDERFRRLIHEALAPVVADAPEPPAWATQAADPAPVRWKRGWVVAVASAVAVVLVLGPVLFLPRLLGDEPQTAGTSTTVGDRDDALVTSPTGPRPESVPLCEDFEPLSGEIINPDAPVLGPQENLPVVDVIEDVNDLGRRYEESYGGRWVDRSLGVFVVAFTGDLEARRADVLEIVGDSVRTMVVEVDHSLADLEAVMNEIGESDLYGAGAAVTTIPGDRPIFEAFRDESHNTVSVWARVLDQPTIDIVTEHFGDEPICLQGPDPSEVVPEGPQPESGDGWRLLVDAPGIGIGYRTEFAGTAEELDALWAEIGLDRPIPEIDFDAEAVIWFGPAVSGTCPDIRLDDVVFDLEERMVRPVIVLPGGVRSCTADINPHAYVVAVDRDRLPARPFTVELREDACETIPGVCREQRTEVGEAAPVSDVEPGEITKGEAPEAEPGEITKGESSPMIEEETTLRFIIDEALTRPEGEPVTPTLVEIETELDLTKFRLITSEMEMITPTHRYEKVVYLLPGGSVLEIWWQQVDPSWYHSDPLGLGERSADGWPVGVAATVIDERGHIQVIFATDEIMGSVVVQKPVDDPGARPEWSRERTESMARSLLATLEATVTGSEQP